MSDPTEFWKIRNGLLQANFLDYQEALRTAPAAPVPSPAHRRWEKRLLRNPAAYRRRQNRPPRTKVLRMAACVLLALGLSCAALLTTSAQAREWVARWVIRESSTHTSYDFQGSVPAGEMAAWAPTYLPEGYAETERINLGNIVDVFYNTDDPRMWIEFSYLRLSEGNGIDLDNEHHVTTVVFINGIYGHLYVSTNCSPNMLTWFEEETGYAFLLSSRLAPKELISIAESIEVYQNKY